MPYIVAFKEPSVTIVLEGSLSMNEKLNLQKKLGETIEAKAIDGQTIIIPLSRDINIAYIKAITRQQYEEMKAKHDGSTRILRPMPIIPKNKIRKG